MFVAIAVVSLVGLFVTLGRGSHPYPFGIKGERRGENPGLFWFAVMLEAAFLAIGVIGAIMQAV